MKSLRFAVACVIADLSFLMLAAPVLAQVAHVPTARMIRPFFGFGVGGGGFPGALQPECTTGGYSGRTPALTADLRVGVTVGALRVESRTAHHASAVLEDCYYIGPMFEQGVHTSRTPRLDRGNATVTDLRVGYASAHTGLHWLLSGGVGWTWSHDIPTVLLGAGLHFGSWIRGVIDVDAIGYRVPWSVLTAEWREFQVINEIDRRRESDWRLGFSVRLGIELAPRLW